MKSSIILICVCLFTSCSMKYGILAGAQKESYKNDISASNESALKDVKIPNYSNSSDGFHFGISEESRFFITKMYFYQNTYSNKVYEDFTTTLKQKGLVTTLGFKLGWLQPFVGFKTYNINSKIDNDRFKESYSIVSFGLDLEVPLSSNLRFYTGYSTSKKKEIENKDSSEILKDKKFHDVKVGLRWNFSVVKAVSTESAPAETK